MSRSHLLLALLATLYLLHNHNVQSHPIEKQDDDSGSIEIPNRPTNRHLKRKQHTQSEGEMVMGLLSKMMVAAQSNIKGAMEQVQSNQRLTKKKKEVEALLKPLNEVISYAKQAKKQLVQAMLFDK